MGEQFFCSKGLGNSLHRGLLFFTKSHKMISSLLSTENYWIVNKPIAKYLQCNNTALLLSELVNKQDYFAQRNELNKDGFFYYKSEDIENELNIGYSTQKKCIAKLIEVGFLEYNRKGTLGKSHFKINEIKIFEFLNSRIAKNVNLNLRKTQISTISNKERIINKNNDDVEKKNYDFAEVETLTKQLQTSTSTSPTPKEIYEANKEIPIIDIFNEVGKDQMYLERLCMKCNTANKSGQLTVEFMKEYLKQVYLEFKHTRKVAMKTRKDGLQHISNLIYKDYTGSQTIYRMAVEYYKRNNIFNQQNQTK